MNLKNAMGTTFGCIFAILFLGYGFVQMGAGYIGIRHEWGTGWAIAAIAACFILRLSLPLTIGAFLAAKNVWHWHSSLALLFAAPGLAFMALMIPSVFASLFRRDQ